ncbi:large conductance mechanosensitive channel protein MscL [soil metagenome]
MRGVAQEFKEFIMRGNVIDLAVAIMIGAAFTAVVTSIVENFITPLIGAIGGSPDFGEVGFTINDSPFRIALIINELISFLIVAAVIFFFVVKPLNTLLERQRRRDGTPDPTAGKCSFCRGEIPLDATRCMFCTSENPLSAGAT